MKLSILDQSPIASNQTAQEALMESVKLAQAGESFGYTRYWIAEHHDLPGLACSAPEVMLGLIGAQTKKIRIGAGAVLLPHYKPYKVAEIYNMLSTLFPNRIDIGIGRSPGGSAEATNALSDNFLQKVFKMPELVDELLHFLHQDFPKESEFSRVTASPIPDKKPVPWMLGTSPKSAILAAQNGLAYAFGAFMSDQDGAAIIKSYREGFLEKYQGQSPQVLVTVPVICAETNEKAEEIALSNLVWQLLIAKGEGKKVPSIEDAKNYHMNEKELDQLDAMKKKIITGNPQLVKSKLQKVSEQYLADEIMILTITHSPQDRIESYRLIASEIL
ncbi:MAG TPA: LLM class flavin-dependent oxidoreductase [Ureibacillus sp.]|nr:LLM class flavin-dependent oxidoreductase [Ureibacillus sp.]